MVEVSITETNLNEQLDFIYFFFRQEAEAKGLTLSYTKGFPDVDSFILSDREKIYAILSNLVKNAIKFTQEGSIRFGYERKGDMLEFCVADTGIGVAEGPAGGYF